MPGPLAGVAAGARETMENVSDQQLAADAEELSFAERRWIRDSSRRLIAAMDRADLLEVLLLQTKES